MCFIIVTEKASFGELSFNANYEHSRRNAGVISDGSHGQSRVLVQTGIANAEGIHGELEASNVSVLMLIPEKTYMEELFARHTAKHETKQKASRKISRYLIIVNFLSHKQ